MWFLNIFLIVAVAGGTIEVSPNEFLELYPDEYTYASTLDCLYKVHALPRTWDEARFQCQAEGAELAVPANVEEAEYLHNLLCKLETPSQGIYTGLHSLFAKGYFVSPTGVPVENLFNKWDCGEPDDSNEDQDCVILGMSGKLDDKSCNRRYPYVCKKLSSSLKTNNARCQTYDLAYQPVESGDRCYKFHLEPKNWKEAYAICRAEGAHLVVLNSEDEMRYLTKKFDKLARNDLYGPTDKHRFLIGFNDLLHEGEFRTIFGQTLQAAGYESWCSGQPDDRNRTQNCGAILHDGTLDDVECDKQYVFACEKETNLL